jgi:hypothetical protein
MSEKLDMKLIPKFNYDKSYSPIKNEQFVRKEIGAASIVEQEFEQKTKKIYLRLCRQLWISPQINWDGKLLGCCVNHWGDYGNVFELGLKKCLRSEKYIYAKKMLLGKKKARKDIPCFYCGVYKGIQSLSICEKILLLEIPQSDGMEFLNLFRLKFKKE